MPKEMFLLSAQQSIQCVCITRSNLINLTQASHSHTQCRIAIVLLPTCYTAHLRTIGGAIMVSTLHLQQTSHFRTKQPPVPLFWLPTWLAFSQKCSFILNGVRHHTHCYYSATNGERNIRLSLAPRTKPRTLPTKFSVGFSTLMSTGYIRFPRIRFRRDSRRSRSHNLLIAYFPHNLWLAII